MASFFTRDKNGLVLNTFDASANQGLSEEQVVLSNAPKAVAWSPDGATLAAVGTQGIITIELGPDGSETDVRVFPNSNKQTQMLWWSPMGTFLVSHHPAERPTGSDARSAPNLLVWDRESLEVVASFLVPKIERGSKKSILSWTPDERLCCRVVPVGPKLFELHILPGEDLNSEPLHVISHPTAMACEWANILRIKDRNLLGRLAVFCLDVRNDLKRVCGDAQVWTLDVRGPDISVVKTAETSIASGESAELLWNPAGTALLAQVETEVDETGVSYYGSTRLVLLAAGKKDVAELNKDGSGQYLPIQAVGWSPTSDHFVLIRGFQPSHVTLWKWDPETLTVAQTQTLLEKAHRNTVKWNPFGNLVLLAGFGSLAGDMDVFGLSKDDSTMAKVSVAHANCTVSADWSPDGQNILTAVLFPRMRVENGFTVFNALTGKAVAKLLIEELFEVGWRPARDTYSSPTQDSIDQMAEAFAVAEPDKPKKQAYRPPKGRDGGCSNSVAAMMRGEIPMERGRKGHRQERVQPSVRGVAEEEPRSRAQTVESTGSPRGHAAPSQLAATSSEKNHKPAPTAITMPSRDEDKDARGPNRHQRHGEKLPCPPAGWEYVDPKGNVQGPFQLVEMQQWHTLGYFRHDLMMRCAETDEFLKLEQLFPHPLIPFRSYPNRPTKRDGAANGQNFPVLQ